jgi:aryl carrier-like protein
MILRLPVHDLETGARLGAVVIPEAWARPGATVRLPMRRRALEELLSGLGLEEVADSVRALELVAEVREVTVASGARELAVVSAGRTLAEWRRVPSFDEEADPR